ncbi:DUF4402 domain-containing protein [Novosphingobium cyanobacteriorum]|uniref:DUF4402 domain-containing protein n=1 Tax=Novosphingobium cyanobacteriorum TaxID=3024215 RepID=A0ABT6CQF4_9SPHN|nr:DUF4402 domain-containing protein [Novosphingobium cyanobacteriorum]MDF8334622.1 DUF4402 domain-containing protein [Novosphingobium cyanobacteriorum]
MASRIFQAWTGCALVAAALLCSAGVRAAEVAVTYDTALRYGRFVVPGTTGSRTVAASGTVTDSGVLPIAGYPVGPGQFTVSYDRESSKGGQTLAIVMLLQLTGGQTVTSGGVSGRIAQFNTDLGGLGSLLPGATMSLSLVSCRTQVCSRSFRVGGRLEVTRNFGGATLAIPVTLTATLLSVAN